MHTYAHAYKHAWTHAFLAFCGEFREHPPNNHHPHPQDPTEGEGHPPTQPPTPQGWAVGYGLWAMGCGLWAMGSGLWAMHGLLAVEWGWGWGCGVEAGGCGLWAMHGLLAVGCGVGLGVGLWSGGWGLCAVGCGAVGWGLGLLIIVNNC